MDQKVFAEKSITEYLPGILADKKIKKLLVVCRGSCKRLNIVKELLAISVEIVWFEDFEPNPTYESVVEGVKVFNETACEAVLAIGGGSAMDVAKCIKLYATMDENKCYLEQEPKDNDITLLAVPTTAGTGSEATRFAVIYHLGEKQSVAHISIIPEYVFLYPEVLSGLPEYQKKATAMDAMCHAIEAFWSVNSTEESKAYSKEAISLILKNLSAYLSGEKDAARNMLVAANIAGKAINITQTTAGHAMCYKLTSLFGIAHGHAAVLCVERLWPYMLGHLDQCLDTRGKTYLEQVLVELADSFGCTEGKDATEKLREMLDGMGLFVFRENVKDCYEMYMEKLVTSVNLTRLKNNPVQLDAETLRKLYMEILGVCSDT